MLITIKERYDSDQRSKLKLQQLLRSAARKAELVPPGLRFGLGRHPLIIFAHGSYGIRSSDEQSLFLPSADHNVQRRRMDLNTHATWYRLRCAPLSTHALSLHDPIQNSYSLRKDGKPKVRRVVESKTTVHTADLIELRLGQIPLRHIEILSQPTRVVRFGNDRDTPLS